MKNTRFEIRLTPERRRELEDLAREVGLSPADLARLGINWLLARAHHINRGFIPDLNPPSTDSDFYYVQADDPETAVGRIVELVKTRIPKRFGLDPIRDVQVLCPMNRGGVGARSLNIELQAALKPAGDHKVERFGWIGPTTVVEAAGMAPPRPIFITADRYGNEHKGAHAQPGLFVASNLT